MISTHKICAGETKMAVRKKTDSNNPTLQYEDGLHMKKVTRRTESLAEQLNKTIMASDEGWKKIYSRNLADHNKIKWGDNFWKNLEIAVAVILI